tara:strand:+ start:76 stop:1314 length:1239 start_codon:yes stop_codon:yes gene_type:complete
MQNIDKYIILKYALIAFPLSFAGLPIYLHAPDFYTSFLGLNIEIIGLSLLFLRSIDAVFDPIIGYVSDRYFIHRLKIIYIGVFFLISGFWMIFNPIFEINYILWFCLSIFLCTFGYSILQINVLAFGGLWNISKNQVTKVMSTREAIGLIGLLSASVLPTMLFYIFQEKSYNSIFMLLIIFLFISLSLFINWVKGAEINEPVKFIKPSLSLIFSTNKIKIFYFTYFFNTFASSIPAALIIFYVRDYLLAESYLGLFLIIYFISGAISMPIWQKIAFNYTNIHSWAISMVFALITFIWAFLLKPGDIYGFFAVCLFSGMSVGANLALPAAIIADFIKEKNNQVYAASYYSITNFISKFSLAIATGISLPLLGFFGYVPGVQITGNLFPLIYAVFPCFILVFAIFFAIRLIVLK